MTEKADQKRSVWKRFWRWLLVVIVGGTILAISQGWGVHLFGPQGKVVQPQRQAVSIEFENDRPFVDRVVYGDDLTRSYWNVYFFQVRIHNQTASPLRVQHVKLTDLRQLEEDGFKPWDAQPVILQWPARVSRDIPPGDAVLVPFARIYPPDLQRKLEEDKIYSGDVNIPQLRFTVDGWPRRMRSDVPPGKHRFKIAAFFTNSLPAETELELEWQGKHRENLDSMAQEIKIGHAGKR